MSNVDNIINTVESVSDKFSNRLSSTEKRLLDEVLNLTKDIAVKDGRIVSSVENLKLLARIKVKLNKVVLNKDYMRSVKELVSGMDTILQSQTAYFNSLSGQNNSDINKKFELVQKMSIDSVVEGLTRTGIEANVTGKINSMLLRSITSGGMYADLVKEMSDFLTTTEVKQGALTRYAQTWVNTSLNQYAGQNNKLLTDDLGLEWYMYVGGNKDTTREFCEHLKDKKYVHVSEIPDIVKGLIDGHQCEIYERTGLPKGMIEGTTAENFQVNNGGWNCGHKLTPVNEVAVPKNIINKFKSKYAAQSNTNYYITQKELKYTDKSLQNFANEILSSKKAGNVLKKLGKIDKSIIDDLKSKGINLISKDILISDKKILKYVNHPKHKKGAVIDFNRFSDVEKAIKKPLGIYQDLVSKEIVYVYTNPYDANKVLKLIIHPNYSLNGNVFNMLKSIGIVNEWDMKNMKLYNKMK